jgi:surface antigen
MWLRHRATKRAAAAICAALLATAPARAEPSIFGGWQCVPFARQMSGVQIFGDAWTWWDQAPGRYAQGFRPKRGAVLVFKPTEVMKSGHVAVVSKVISPRIIMVTHANWSRIGGVRGQPEQDVTVVDTSSGGNWSTVRVWYDSNGALGGRTYPTYGFIYGDPASSQSKVRKALPSPHLTGPSPDIIGAVIDSLS